MARRLAALVLVLVVATGAVHAAASGKAGMTRTDDAVSLSLPHGVQIEFALEGDYLLGLHRARVDGVQLKSADTCMRPVIAQEWEGDRMISTLLRLRAVEAGDKPADGYTLVIDLLGTNHQDAYRAFFVYGPDREAASGTQATDEIKELAEKKEAAEALIHSALLQADEKYKEAYEAQQAARQAVDAAKSKHERLGAEAKLSKAERTVTKWRRRTMPKLQTLPAIAEAQQAIEAFSAAVTRRGMEIGKIHRDFYKFAHTRLPAEICDVAFLRQQVERWDGKLKPMGTLRWHIRPDTRNIAGWQWKGWRQSYSFELAGGRKVNKLRQVGTWELGGSAAGLTVVNMRYRGLGEIEQRFTPREGNSKAITEAFSTTETMPGAAGGGYAVSPVIPQSKEKELTDRGYALQHRVGAWICHVARGAGHGFVDFQYRPEAALTSFFVRQDSLRALTEAFPGDTVLSQTDDIYFANTSKQQTVPQVFVALVTKDDTLTASESRTRWQEVDQYVRDMVSSELGYVQHEVLPAMGELWDVNFGGNISALAAHADELSEQGVKMILLHNPGYFNGRSIGAGADGTRGMTHLGGGVCNVYDWLPLPTAEKPWKRLTKALAEHDIAYYVWLSGMSTQGGAFWERVGDVPEARALNMPGAPFDANDTYGKYMPKHNILHEPFKKEFTATLEKLRTEYGYQGFWGDSFQNLFMSQLDWNRGTGASLQRAWWEWLAARTREGVGWMAESHSFPGLSCSIEVHGWEKHPWFFQHVCKWHRGPAQNNYTGAQLERMLFQIMANKGWTAPDKSTKVIPNFKRFAHEYTTALPYMRRSYILPDGRGVLWLSFKDDKRGVVFAFEDMATPDAARAIYILADPNAKAGPVARLSKHHTYAVAAADLLKAFGVRRGLQPDPRLGRTYKRAGYTWPQWATGDESGADASRQPPVAPMAETVFCSVPAPTPRAKAAEPARTFKVVCFGDSITGHRPGESYQGHYLKFADLLQLMLEARLGAGRVEVVNSGWAGDATYGKPGQQMPGAVARLQRDVLAHRPDVAVVMIGGNDRIEAADDRRRTEENLLRITKSIADAGIRLLVLQYPPAMAASENEDKAWKQLAEKNPLIAAAARKADAEVLDMGPIMLAAAKRWGAEQVVNPIDGVHLQPRGEMVYARAIFAKLDRLGWVGGSDEATERRSDEGEESVSESGS